MRPLGRAAAAAALAAAALGATAREPAPSRALAAFFEREFRYELAQHPETATELGIAGYDDRLADRSAAAIAARKAHVKAAIRTLTRFDPARLGREDRISRAVMLEQLRTKDALNALYAGLPFGADRSDSWLQLSPMHGPHALLAQLARAAPFADGEDYARYVKRLEALPRLLEQSRAAMEAGMRSGWVPPAAAMARVPDMLAPFGAGDPAASPLWAPFERFPGAMPAQERERWRAAGRRVLAGRVQPAFAAYRDFVQTRYLPACRDTLSASALPAGAAYYDLRVRESTTSALGAEEIHALGEREVKRIGAAMDEAIAATGFPGDLGQFLTFVRTDPRFFFRSAEERLSAYRDIAKRADAALPRLFAVLPRLPYGVRAMEAYEGDNADHYTPGAADGSRAGWFEANVNHLGKRPSPEMTAVLLHEAVPGHHLQTARAYELAGLPRFRRTGWYVAYGEGWALYAESLGYEMGMYDDPYARFGALSAEMLRACRLVVDTGLHRHGWTRERAIAYLVDNAGLHPDFAAAEVDRYIVWPAQALGYKIGELRIQALRAKAAAALGPRFDLRRFHNAILDEGPLPLTVLEERIDAWIAAQRR